MSSSPPPTSQSRPSAEDALRVTQLKTTLGDRYEIEELLGKGGAGRVYRVRNLHLGRVEALKVLIDYGEEDGTYARRFTQEARVAASLDHPNIVTVFDHGDTQGLLWFSMELVEGPSLANLIAAVGRLSEDSAVAIVLPVLDALSYIHARGIVHRDVKPSNIMIDTAGMPRLMDFGVAKIPDSTTKTTTGAVLGSPAYLAPEQFAGGEVDGRTDIYGLGVTLYEALTGSLPFGGGNPFQVMVTRLQGSVEPVTARCPELDPELAAIVSKALERDPARRFASAHEMHAQLWQWWVAKPRVGSLPTLPSYGQARLVPPGEPPAQGSTARLGEGRKPVPRWLLAVAAVGVAALVSTGVALLGPWSEQPAALPRVAPVASRGPTPGPAPTATPLGPVPTATPPALAATTATGPAAGEAAPRPRATTAPTSEAPPRRPVTMPEELARVEPEVPAELAERCAGQQVMLALVVGADGRVERARVLRTALAECGEAAVRAAREFTYRPALDAAGNPVEASISIAVTLGVPEAPVTPGPT